MPESTPPRDAQQQAKLARLFESIILRALTNGGGQYMLLDIHKLDNRQQTLHGTDLFFDTAVSICPFQSILLGSAYACRPHLRHVNSFLADPTNTTLARACRLLVIFDVQFLAGDRLRHLERTLRSAREDPRPFGNVTVVCFGDQHLSFGAASSFFELYTRHFNFGIESLLQYRALSAGEASIRTYLESPHLANHLRQSFEQRVRYRSADEFIAAHPEDDFLMMVRTHHEVEFWSRRIGLHRSTPKQLRDPAHPTGDGRVPIICNIRHRTNKKIFNGARFFIEPESHRKLCGSPDTQLMRKFFHLSMRAHPETQTTGPPSERMTKSEKKVAQKPNKIRLLGRFIRNHTKLGWVTTFASGMLIRNYPQLIFVNIPRSSPPLSPFEMYTVLLLVFTNNSEVTLSTPLPPYLFRRNE